MLSACRGEQDDDSLYKASKMIHQLTSSNKMKTLSAGQGLQQFLLGLDVSAIALSILILKHEIPW